MVKRPHMPRSKSNSNFDYGLCGAIKTRERSKFLPSGLIPCLPRPGKHGAPQHRHSTASELMRDRMALFAARGVARIRTDLELPTDRKKENVDDRYSAPYHAGISDLRFAM